MMCKIVHRSVSYFISFTACWELLFKPLYYLFLIVEFFFDKYNFLFSCRRLLPLILLAIIVFLTIIAAPSGFYAKAKEAGPTTVPANSTTTSNSNSNSNKQQYCDLYVPPITGSDSPDLQDQANMTYRLVYCLYVILYYYWYSKLLLVFGVFEGKTAIYKHVFNSCKSDNIGIVTIILLVNYRYIFR